MLDIALGKWICHVDTFIFSGDIKLNVKNKNGEYDFELDMPGFDMPNFEIISISETADSVAATIFVPALKKEAEINVTFTGDTVNGYIKVPFMGKIKIKNGKKISG